MTNRNDMEIAPGVKAGRWLALHLDDPLGRDWEHAIAILDGRIRARYLDPIDLLLASEDRPENRWRFGFTVLAIDCLLVETIQAFRLGLRTTRSRSKEMFRLFLTQRPHFAKSFATVERAEQLWEYVRCGILHQGEVRGGWRVWAVGPLMTPIHTGFRVNRTEFHRRMAAEFEDYKKELKDPTSTTLRTNFRSKMDHICTAT